MPHQSRAQRISSYQGRGARVYVRQRRNGEGGQRKISSSSISSAEAAEAANSGGPLSGGRPTGGGSAKRNGRGGRKRGRHRLHGRGQIPAQITYLPPSSPTHLRRYSLATKQRKARSRAPLFYFKQILFEHFSSVRPEAPLAHTDPPPSVRPFSAPLPPSLPLVDESGGGGGGREGGGRLFNL